jgi:hypothetical protein
MEKAHNVCTTQTSAALNVIKLNWGDRLMSCFFEKDPRDIAYAALYLSIIWYKFLDADQAWRIMKGQSCAKPGNKITPKMLGKIVKIMKSPNFKNFKGIEHSFRVDKRDVIEAIRRNPSAWGLKKRKQDPTRRVNEAGKITGGFKTM